MDRRHRSVPASAYGAVQSTSLTMTFHWPRLRGLLMAFVMLVAGASVAVATPGLANAATLPGFQEEVVFSGLNNQTAVRFAADGQVFVAEKRGVIKVFDSLSDPTPTVFADLNSTSTTFGTAACSAWRSLPTSPATRMSMCSIPTTTNLGLRRQHRDGARLASTPIRVRRLRARPVTDVWSAVGCRGCRQAATK